MEHLSLCLMITNPDKDITKITAATIINYTPVPLMKTDAKILNY